MNDPTNRQAMIAVERVVGPVRASLARKRRMRHRASVTSTEASKSVLCARRSHRPTRPNRVLDASACRTEPSLQHGRIEKAEEQRVTRPRCHV